MEIIDEVNNLKNQLDSYEKKDIVIVSAFVSGIFDHLKDLIKRNKHVALYTGVLNGFNNPKDLEKIYYLAKKEEKKFDFYVNFDENTSTHWKLYLVFPSTVIVGSANYTDVGLKSFRDTMFLVKKSEVYDQYREKIACDKNYCNSKKKAFLDRLNSYKKNWKGIRTWDVANEVNIRIPIFVWRKNLSEDDKREILEKANKNCNSFEEKIERKSVREFFCMSKGKASYKEGNRVFCVKDNGSYPSFYYFNRIFSDDDTTYVISLKRTNKKSDVLPVSNKNIVKALKKMSRRGGQINSSIKSVLLYDVLEALK